MASDNAVLSGWLQNLETGLAKGGREVAALFQEDGFWRDLISHTWNIKTCEGRDEIAAMVDTVAGDIQPAGFRLRGDASSSDGITEGWFDFETLCGRGEGYVRLKSDGAWTCLTALKELKGFEEACGASRDTGVEHGQVRGRLTWKERREREETTLGYSGQPYVLIIGGGQGGIALGARLRRLGVPTLIIDRNDRPGDSWRNRYKSLCLHDPVWYDHLPYLPFPDHWPVFSPKDKIADWLESYTRIMELNYWTRSVAKSAQYDEAEGIWTVEVERDHHPVTLRPRHLVLATGMSGVPNMPDIPGMESFKGIMCHSSAHEGSDAHRGSGKRAVVIGSNNSAHDICHDFWENGIDVTMVQRSSTLVIRSETLMDLGLKALYSEQALANGIDTHTADILFASLPYRVLPSLQKPIYDRAEILDRDFYDGLRRVGFMRDRGDDDTGLFVKYLRRGSGYYIDVGASRLVANGEINLKTGQITDVTEGGVIVDGEEIPADILIFATGYGSMNGWAEQLIGKDVADRVGRCWGLGSGTTKDPGPWEGELRNMWKPTRQEALWFH
ncbi:MAG: NAD(P)/FAD-dependent oxidoreductase, partial [Rhodobacteraceae bacterium]|nr:NAD(P)/FAD-dependent oxidoreductase [Paracoccaceae bacterium]